MFILLFNRTTSLHCKFTKHFTSFALCIKNGNPYSKHLYSRYVAGSSTYAHWQNWHIYYFLWSWLSKVWIGRFYQLSAESPVFSASDKWPFRNNGFNRKGCTIHFCFFVPEASFYPVQPTVLSTSTVVHFWRCQLMILHSYIYISGFQPTLLN